MAVNKKDVTAPTIQKPISRRKPHLSIESPVLSFGSSRALPAPFFAAFAASLTDSAAVGGLMGASLIFGGWQPNIKKIIHNIKKFL